MTVAVISAGHMGSGLGWALREGGVRVLTTLAGRSERSARLAAAAGLETLPTLEALITAVDEVLVVTPPDAARSTAAALAAAAHATGARPLVADLNAVAPSTVAELARLYADAGLPFVDGAISGPPPNSRPGARIYLCGPNAARLAALPWRHVEPIVLPGPVGRASGLKMCTASVYKGLDGLLAQAMRAAAHYGVLDSVLADLRRAGYDNPGRIAVTAAKAHRYVPEMREIAAAQQAAGLTPALFTALANVYAELATSPFGNADPETVDSRLPPAEIITGITPA